MEEKVKGQDEMFCSSCGSIIKKEAVICPHCGVPTRKVQGPLPPSAKNKSTAVLLSVFLSFWSWLYTYKKNSYKFWIGLGVFIFYIVCLGLFSAISESTPGSPNAGIAIVPIFAVLLTAIWIWAIVDNATKPQEWYQNYPNA